VRSTFGQKLPCTKSIPSGQVEASVAVSVVFAVAVGVEVEVEVELSVEVDEPGVAFPLLACAHPARASATSALTPLRA